MDITAFKERAHRICDRWYFLQTTDEFIMKERPYRRGPGYWEDPVILRIPLEVMCKGETRSEFLTRQLQKLAYAHTQRQLGNQGEHVKALMDDIERGKASRKATFQAETRSFLKDTRKVFRDLGHESGMTRTNAQISAAGAPGGLYEDGLRAFDAQLEARMGMT